MPETSQKSDLLLKDFDFDLPKELIAQEPLLTRDHARLLDVKPGCLVDRQVRDIVSLLHPGDVLVLNNTQVIPARLYGKRTEASIECTLHKQCSDDSWEVFAKPAKRLRVGEVVVFSPDFSAKVRAKEEGICTLQFNHSGEALFKALETYGSMPLPPYIKRDKSALRQEDNEQYQTVYAEHKGAVAAPTAGLHFTPDLLDTIKAKGVQLVYVTLHVGAGTFLPVKVEDITQHQMHSEYCVLGAAEAAILNNAKQQGKRVVAVGTTSLRVLESAADAFGKVKPFAGETDIFIYPGYRFKLVDMLMTNFHLPCSTLFMLVCAFAGMDRMKSAYAHAINSGYRFFSYGDTSILTRSDYI